MHEAAFLASAERIIRQNSSLTTKCDGCSSRAAIHAAYYSVFHFVAKALGQKVTGEGYSKHGDVWRVLKARSGETAALYEARKVFQSLRKLRQRADYELDDDVAHKDALDAVHHAVEVFKTAGIIPAVA